MKALRVKDWSINYENNRTRELKFMEWVPVPNKMDGFGYNTLVSSPQGAANLGCWLAIVEIASRCDTRGTLIRNGIPLTVQDLSNISRLSVSALESAILILIDRCKWLEEIDLACDRQDVGSIPQVDAFQCPRARVSETETEAEAEEDTFPPPPSPSEAMAAEPPEKENSTAVVQLSPVDQRIAEVAQRLKSRHPPFRSCGIAEISKNLRAIVKRSKAAGRMELLDAIDRNHEAWCDSEQWTSDGGEYAKGLANWLAPTQERYLAQPPTWQPRSRGQPSKIADAVEIGLAWNRMREGGTG